MVLLGPSSMPHPHLDPLANRDQPQRPIVHFQLLRQILLGDMDGSEEQGSVEI